jgi:uncharacterized protein (TIRG00374 family)
VIPFVQSRPAVPKARLKAGASLSQRLKRLAPWLLMAVVVLLLGYFLDLHATFAALDNVEAWAIGLSAALFLLDRFCMAYKWNILLRERNCHLSAWSAFRIYLASGFVGYVIPASVGSDTFRAARLSLSGWSVSRVSATIILERVLGLLAILALSSVGLFFLVARGRGDLFPLLGVVLAALLVGLVLTTMSTSERLYRILQRATSGLSGHRMGARVVQMLHELHNEYVALSKGRRPLLLFFLLSIVSQLIEALMVVPLLVSLDAPLDLLAVFALLPLSKAMIQLMAVPAGIGVAEGSVVVALTLAGISPAQALATALVLRAIDLGMLLPAGIAYAADAWQLRKTA